MAFLPKAHQPWQDSNLPAVEARQHAIHMAWNKVIASISHTQSLWQRSPQFHPYQKGDRVWLEGTHLHTSHPTHKLRPKQFGLFEVTEELSLVTYRLDLPPTWKLHNAFHASLLHPYHETREHGGNQVPPAPELIEGEPEWEVEAILASRRHGPSKQLQYLVKWVGYPESEVSWEPVENLQAPRLVHRFHKDNLAAAKGIKCAEHPQKQRRHQQISASSLPCSASKPCPKEQLR